MYGLVWLVVGVWVCWGGYLLDYCFRVLSRCVCYCCGVMIEVLFYWLCVFGFCM